MASILSSKCEIDDWGRVVVAPEDIFEIIYRGVPTGELNSEPTDEIIRFNELCRKWNRPDDQIQFPTVLIISPEDMEKKRLSDWSIPPKYEALNVRAELLQRCKNSAEIDRVNMEMDLYEKMNLLKLLQLSFFLVDHWREQGVIVGVGRGSSTASYVLFLIRLHRIDSLKYDLDIREFLK